MKRFLLSVLAAALCLVAGAQDRTRGYYKDIFMDSGIMLNSRTDLPVTDLLGLSMEAFVSTKHVSSPPQHFTLADTLRQRELIVGSPMDENGILLYPDGAPRFRMIYVNGGKAANHARSLEDAGKQAYRDFVAAGGSYVGSCAGAFLAGAGSRTPEGKINYDQIYIGLWPGYTVGTKLEKSYTAVDIVPNGPLTRYFDFDGRMHIDSVRHNGGCFPYMESAPAGTEILATFSTKGRELKRDIDGAPVIWAWKASPATGRVLLCGSHPEGAYDAENLSLMAAMVRYALDGNGEPALKAALNPGDVRKMNDRSQPAFAPIGDRQYHHFCIDVPKGVKTMTIDLKGFVNKDDFDLHLFASRTGFAFAEKATWAYVGTKVDKTLEIKDPKPGKYYISVFCATTVTSTMGKYGVEYSGRTDVLNGVPYTIQVNFE